MARERNRGGARGGDRDRFGGGRRSPPRGGRFNDRRGFRKGNPPGRKTEYRVLVENLSSKTSWQVRIVPDDGG